MMPVSICRVYKNEGLRFEAFLPLSSFVGGVHSSISQFYSMSWISMITCEKEQNSRTPLINSNPIFLIA